MNEQTILNIIGMAEAIVKGVTSLVDNATDVLKDDSADRVMEAAKKLRAANDALDQAVLTKLG